jgi:hypothetical protein
VPRCLSFGKNKRANSRNDFQASDVTLHLSKPPASHCSLAEDAPREWFGIKSSDVTKVLQDAGKCPKPPSRDYFFGIQSSDVLQTATLRPRPLNKTDGDDEPRQYFGRPKSDITNFKILPKWNEEQNSCKTNLGRCGCHFDLAHLNKCTICGQSN